MSVDLKTYSVAAASLHRVRYRALLRALFRARFRDMELSSCMPEFQCRIQSRIRSRVTATMPILHKPCEINLGRATIFKEGDDSAGIGTTPTANYRTGSAGTKHHETHSPIEQAGSGKCMWRRSNNCTPRTAKVHAKK